jgi:hypothetical protein
VTGPSDKGEKAGDPPSNDDAVWREIVDNYGDRPVLEPPQQEHQQARAPGDEPDAQPELVEEQEPAERFVPPPPPPLPRVPRDRFAAWLGVLVSPLLLLVATVLRISLPTMVAWLLIVAFLGGFGYLVAQMPRGPRDPFDDGARL